MEKNEHFNNIKKVTVKYKVFIRLKAIQVECWIALYSVEIWIYDTLQRAHVF